MNEFMKLLLTMSVSGTLLLLLILGLIRLYKNKFSRRWQYYICLIAVLRFLIPFTPGTINVGRLLEGGLKGFHTADIMDKGPEMLDRNVTVNGNKEKQTYIYLFFVWSAMALALSVRKIRIYQGFIQCVKAGNVEVSDVRALNLLSGCEEKLNIKTGAGLYCNALIVSPIMIGYFRPSIVLPVRELGDQELPHIFMHELLHYKRRDMLYKWLVQLVVCIHWFNPFAYLLEKEVNKACELSCDEAVISMLDEPARREYGDMLISFLKPTNHCKDTLSFMTLSDGAEQLKERLGAIMDFREKTKGMRILMGVLALCIIFGAVFIGGYSDAPVTGLNSAVTGKSLIPEEQNPVVSTADENSGRASEPPIPEGKSRSMGTYIPNWENWDGDWDWDDKALMEAYAACGIEKNGKFYYYCGETVYILKNQRPDSSIYLINTEGTVSIKVNWNAEGEITGVSYIAKEEVEKLKPKLLGTS